MQALWQEGARRPFGHVLVIPAYGELDDMLATLDSVPRGPCGDVLIIVVVNQRKTAETWAAKANRALIEALERDADSSRSIAKHAQMLGHPRGSLLLLDHTRPESALPDREGVGLARKIGCDVALALWHEGGLVSPWIHCSDADVALPGDYFDRIGTRAATEPGVAVCIYDFEHVRDGDPPSHAAALRYEIYLRYYVLGLRHAGSPYAYHSISSTLAIEAAAYAKVRGFPKRQAGEDFHVLNKLAKVGRVASLHGEAIALSGRISDRVPFGTGRAITQELSRIMSGDTQPAYDPRVFAYLKVWIDTLNDLGGEESDPGAAIAAIARQHAEQGPALDADLLLAALAASGDGPRLVAALPQMGRRRDLRRHLHEKFDALRTLKLIHALRDHFPSRRLDQVLEEAPFISLDAPFLASELHDIPRLQALRKHLADLENGPIREASRPPGQAPSP